MDQLGKAFKNELQRSGRLKESEIAISTRAFAEKLSAENLHLLSEKRDKDMTSYNRDCKPKSHVLVVPTSFRER